MKMRGVWQALPYPASDLLRLLGAGSTQIILTRSPAATTTLSLEVPIQMPTSNVCRWLGAASLVATATLAPQAAHASDDYKVYDSRSAFESALNASHGGSHVTTPGASGVTFTTVGIATNPSFYDAGQTGNLFGNEAASVGYSGLIASGLNMTLPSSMGAFGFDYRYNPAKAPGQAVTFEGEFCSWLGICHSYAFEALNGGSGFIGITAESGVTGALLSGTAKNVQVANLTFAGPNMTVTPEPGTIALLGTGIAGLAGFGVARRRRESSNS